MKAEQIKRGRKILEDVRENHRKITTCDLHDFSIDLDPDKPMNKRWACVHCGGYIWANNKVWYELGRNHQRRHSSKEVK